MKLQNHARILIPILILASLASSACPSSSKLGEGFSIGISRPCHQGQNLACGATASIVAKLRLPRWAEAQNSVDFHHHCLRIRGGRGGALALHRPDDADEDEEQKIGEHVRDELLRVQADREKMISRHEMFSDSVAKVKIHHFERSKKKSCLLIP
jgi:hypothetical protein